jgi:hypothetical protein
MLTNFRSSQVSGKLFDSFQELKNLFNSKKPYILILTVTAGLLLFLALNNGQELNIKIKDGLTPGELSHLHVSKNEVPVEGAKIFIHGEAVGVTDYNGNGSFYVPNKNEMSLKVEKENMSKTKIFQLNGNNPKKRTSAEINWEGPKIAETNKPEMELEIESDHKYDLAFNLNKNAEPIDNNLWRKEGVNSEIRKHAFTPEPLPKGTQKYEISVYDQKGSLLGNKKGTFGITGERGLVEIEEISIKNKEEMELNNLPELAAVWFNGSMDQIKTVPPDSRLYIGASEEFIDEELYKINQEGEIMIKDKNSVSKQLDERGRIYYQSEEPENLYYLVIRFKSYEDLKLEAEIDGEKVLEREVVDAFEQIRKRLFGFKKSGRQEVEVTFSSLETEKVLEEKREFEIR